MRGLRGKVAIITGSTEGIGFAIAERLGEEGVKVVVSSRTESKVKAAVDKLKVNNVQVVGTVCDVTKQEDLRQLVETAVATFGAVDFLVSNVADFSGMGLRITEGSTDRFRANVDANLTPCVELTKYLLPHMKKRGSGGILLISSYSAFGTQLYSGSYAVSKAGMLTLTKQLSMELAKHNIRVNCIAPGVVHTPALEKLFGSVEELSKNRQLRPVIEMTTLKRIAQAEEIAGPAAFLLSHDASYITGETLVVAGGMHARL